jgi:hypothetical protein
MPTEDGLGLDNQQALMPGVRATGEQNQERAVGRGAARAFDAALEEEDLVAEEGVLRRRSARVPATRGAAAGLLRARSRCGRAWRRPEWERTSGGRGARSWRSLLE